MNPPALNLVCLTEHPKTPGLNPGDKFSLDLAAYTITLPITPRLMGDILAALDAGAITPTAPYPTLPEVLRSLVEFEGVAALRRAG